MFLGCNHVLGGAAEIRSCLQSQAPEPSIQDCLACNGQGKLPTHSSQGKLIHSCPWCGEIGMVYAEVNQAYLRVSHKNTGVRYCQVWGTKGNCGMKGYAGENA